MTTEAFARRHGLGGRVPPHEHDAGDIFGTFAQIFVAGDVWSSNWNGATPASLGAGADATASAGFYLDSSAGAIQATTIYAKGGTLGALTVDGTITVGAGGGIQSSDFDGTHGFQLSPTGLTVRATGSVISADAIDATQLDAITANMGTLTVDESLTMGTGAVIKSADYDATHGWQLSDTGLVINVGTIEAPTINATQLDQICALFGTIQVDETLTLAGTGKIITGVHGVGAPAIEIRAANNDRILFYGGSAYEEATGGGPGYILSTVNVGIPYLSITSQHGSVGSGLYASGINIIPGVAAGGGQIMLTVGNGPTIYVGNSAGTWAMYPGAGTVNLGQSGATSWATIYATTDVKVGGTSVSLAGHTHDYSGVYLGISAKAADSDKLDGSDSTAFATSGHTHSTLGNLAPTTDLTYDLGTSAASWQALYAQYIYDQNGVSRITLSSTWSPAGSIIPTADSTPELGSATYSWGKIYAYEIYDEAGSCYVDMSGIALINPSNTQITAGATNAQLDTYEGAAFQARLVAAQGGNISMYDTDGDVRLRIINGAEIKLVLANGSTVGIEVAASGDNPVSVRVGGALKNVTVDGSGFLKAA